MLIQICRQTWEHLCQWHISNYHSAARLDSFWCEKGLKNILSGIFASLGIAERRSFPLNLLHSKKVFWRRRIYNETYTNTHMHIRIHGFMHLRMYRCMHTQTHMYTDTDTQKHRYLYESSLPGIRWIFKVWYVTLLTCWCTSVTNKKASESLDGAFSGWRGNGFPELIFRRPSSKIKQQTSLYFSNLKMLSHPLFHTVLTSYVAMLTRVQMVNVCPVSHSRYDFFCHNLLIALWI